MTWDELKDSWIGRQLRRVPFWVWWCLGGLVVGVLISCAPADARADSDPAPRFTVSTAKVAAGVFRLSVRISCGGSGPDSVHL